MRYYINNPISEEYKKKSRGRCGIHKWLELSHDVICPSSQKPMKEKKHIRKHTHTHTHLLRGSNFKLSIPGFRKRASRTILLQIVPTDITVKNVSDILHRDIRRYNTTKKKKLTRLINFSVSSTAASHQYSSNTPFKSHEGLRGISVGIEWTWSRGRMNLKCIAMKERGWVRE